MPERPRILVLTDPAEGAPSPRDLCSDESEFVRADSIVRGMELVRAESFEGIYFDMRAGDVAALVHHLQQARHVLDTLPEGVAIVGADLKVQWSNAAFDHWCGGPARGRPFYEALGSPEILGPDYSPFHTALAGKAVATRLHYRDNHYLDAHVTPVQEPGQPVRQMIVLTRDVTPEAQQQQKLDALQRAGEELAGLDPNQLAEMSPEERVELLKMNIRRLTHDLLKYDVIEIRLLDPQTGRLEPLLQEGMTGEAAGRVLYARAEGNGVTGFVAATGKSYLCPDTATDPLYLEGSPGARSSLTVPLVAQDQVIGTFNVESPQPNTFGEHDVQFAEIFSRQLAGALHTLELLSAEKRTAATQSIEAINREVALPVDDILNAATAVLERYIGHEPEIAEKLKQILASARALKQSIQKVGEDLAPPKAPAGATPPVHPRLRGLRVLVVDNDDRVRRSAHSILGRFGCIVETARDGREALTMARLSGYDAILADIRLPDINGYEAFVQLRQIQPQARTILMTSYGYDPSHSLVKARQEGLRFVLYKPFRIDQLLDALEKSDDGPPGAAPAPPEAHA